MRRWILSILTAVLLTVGAAGAQDLPATGPLFYPPGVNPLTGLPVANPANLNRRPLNIKISNFPSFVRPQSGLNSADIVWEHLVEGGVTRFTAVFLSEDVDHVGPVRSARLIDIDLARIYGSLLVYSGMSEGTIDRVLADPLVGNRLMPNRGCPPLCRFPQQGVAFEHTLFGDTQGLHQQAAATGRDDSRAQLSGMAFSEALPPGGVAAVSGINIAYRQTETGWEYDPFNARWLRSQDGEAHIDALSGSQVYAANVVVLESNHIEQPFVREGYWGNGNYAFTVDLVGSGPIYLFRDGQYFIGEWRRENENAPLTFVDSAGNPLLFKPGRTFFNLVPRWVEGYELTFLPSTPPTATVTAALTNLHTGPGIAYRTPLSAAAGDHLPAVGRNGVGDWIQVLTADDEPLWISAGFVTLNGFDVHRLPRVRSTIER